MTDTNHAEEQARAQVASIVAMVAALGVDYEQLETLREMRDDRELDALGLQELAELEEAAGECTSEDDARERIQEDALSVEVRSGWARDVTEFEAEEFRIVLCTGGPHVEIIGDLDANREPCSPRIIYKDWGTSGELFDFDRDAVLAYCQQFIFGE